MTSLGLATPLREKCGWGWRVVSGVGDSVKKREVGRSVVSSGVIEGIEITV